MTQTLYDMAGGAVGTRQLAEAFYRRVFADPTMVPLFRNPDDDHVGRMALWLAEFFGGPAEHSRQRGGFYTVIAAHERLGISNQQREHWVTYMLAACEEIGMSDEVRSYFEPHIHFGALAAQRHSY